MIKSCQVLHAICSLFLPFLLKVWCLPMPLLPMASQTHRSCSKCRPLGSQTKVIKQDLGVNKVPRWLICIGKFEAHFFCWPWFYFPFQWSSLCNVKLCKLPQIHLKVGSSKSFLFLSEMVHKRTHRHIWEASKKV